jgi:hypothetical protein
MGTARQSSSRRSPARPIATANTLSGMRSLSEVGEVMANAVKQAYGRHQTGTACFDRYAYGALAAISATVDLGLYSRRVIVAALANIEDAQHRARYRFVLTPYSRPNRRQRLAAVAHAHFGWWALSSRGELCIVTARDWRARGTEISDHRPC